MSSEEFSPDDVKLIMQLANSESVEKAVDFINDDEYLVEQAWLSAAQESLERQWVVTVMTAYAHAKGLLSTISLSLPEVWDEDGGLPNA